MTTGLEAVRADLAARVAGIEGVRRTRELAAEVDAIRAIARRAGLHPAATVAHLLEDALARGERPQQGWIGLLGEAIRCERTDALAAQAFAAACTVRFAG